MGPDVTCFVCLGGFLPLLFAPLALVVPGKVKVDLANFDIKFWTKFSSIGFKKKKFIPAEMSSKTF
jgi:hypothetical protein